MKIGVRVHSRRWLPVVAVLAVASAIFGSVSQAAAHRPSPRLVDHHGRGHNNDRGEASLTATALRVEGLSDPIGLGDASPSLSWSFWSSGRSHSSAARQTAYEIRVASSPWRLDHPDLWDSGRVLSSDASNIPYGGASLRSREDAVWQVRVWDGYGRAGGWSAPGTWEMGLLSQSDWSGRWIEDPSYSYATNGVPNPLPIFGRSFDVGRRIVKARLYATGLGGTRPG